MNDPIAALELALPILIDQAACFFGSECVPRECDDGEFEPMLSTFDPDLIDTGMQFVSAIRAAEAALNIKSPVAAPWLRRLIDGSESSLGGIPLDVSMGV